MMKREYTPVSDKNLKYMFKIMKIILTRIFNFILLFYVLYILIL